MSGLLACLALPASAARAELPNLVSDPASGAYLSVQSFAPGDDRLLLRFNSFVHNRGPGVLHIRGRNPVGGATMADVFQVEDSVTETPLPTGGEVVYEEGNLANEDGHDHWHLQNAARYSLYHLNGVTQAGPAAKVGFCLLDSSRVSSEAVGSPRAPQRCGHSASTQINMGVSGGYRDVYGSNLAFQWVNVSDVQPGNYLLRSEVDPDDLVDETNESNGWADLPVRIPGYRAKARSVPLGPVTVGLDADRVEPMSGTMGAPRYRIKTPPQHGTLDLATGTWSANRFVRYTPDDPSSPQPDTFEYVVRASDSAFPRDAALIPQTVTVGPGSAVAISGAPDAMVGGTSVQLTAPAGVTWSASRGTITSGGLFTAPLTAGPVVVSAVNAGGTADSKTIDVTAPPPPTPAPLPAGAPSGDSALVPPDRLAPVTPARLPRRTIESAQAQRIGRYIAVTVRPGRSGTLRVLLRRGSRTLARCRTRATAGRAYACRLPRPRGTTRGLRVVLELRRLDGRSVRRGVRISTARVH